MLGVQIDGYRTWHSLRPTALKGKGRSKYNFRSVNPTAGSFCKPLERHASICHNRTSFGRLGCIAWSVDLQALWRSPSLSLLLGTNLGESLSPAWHSLVFISSLLSLVSFMNSLTSRQLLSAQFPSPPLSASSFSHGERSCRSHFIWNFPSLCLLLFCWSIWILFVGRHLVHILLSVHQPVLWLRIGTFFRGTTKTNTNSGKHRVPYLMSFLLSRMLDQLFWCLLPFCYSIYVSRTPSPPYTVLFSDVSLIFSRLPEPANLNGFSSTNIS